MPDDAAIEEALDTGHKSASPGDTSVFDLTGVIMALPLEDLICQCKANKGWDAVLLDCGCEGIEVKSTCCIECPQGSICPHIHPPTNVDQFISRCCGGWATIERNNSEIFIIRRHMFGCQYHKICDKHL